VEAGHEGAGAPRGVVVGGARGRRGRSIGAEEVPAAIDELPLLAIAATFAEGETRITGARELRVKESDRLAALEQLGSLGANVWVTADGLVVHGLGAGMLRGGHVESRGDHRIAMAFAVAGLPAERGVEIDDAECVAVSFPGFFSSLAELGAIVEGR